MTSGDGFGADDPAGYPQSDRPVDVPLHAPGEMTVDARYPVRSVCWDRLDATLRDRLHELAGTVLAVLLGDQDLTVASGTMLIPEGHSSATAHWSLLIHRALVTPWAEQN